MIKFVYFDVGGVVIDDFSGNDGWSQLKAEIGVTTQMDEHFMAAWYPYEQEVVVGRDIETLLPIFKEKFGLPTNKDYSLLDGFVKRFKVNKPIWPIIEKVKQKHRVGLLTNMYPNMLDAIEQKNLLPDIAWDVVVDSSVEMLKKPDFKLYELAEQKAAAKGKELLFIDNNVGHLDAAKAFGWRVYHYDSSDHVQSSRKLELFLKAQSII